MKPTGAHLLLVDDYPDALEVWTMFLTASGYTVSSASSGNEALSHARERTPDLVVLDLQLPDISGLEVARQLRQNDATRNLPLIALTGRALQSDVDEALAAGFTSVLIKPCEPADLLALIKRLIDERAPATSPLPDHTG